MLVLHGFWSGRRGLCLGPGLRGCRQSPSQALRSARPHPFAAPAGTLAGSGSVLRQLPPTGVTVRGQALADLLGPAYTRFGDS
jgi:hypothetical protein